MQMNFNKIAGHIRFWLWGAMHYKRFDQFQLLLVPPSWVAPHYYSEATKEWLFIAGVRLPKVVILEPTIAELCCNVPFSKLPGFVIRDGSQFYRYDI
jgi:hypothetical protein